MSEGGGRAPGLFDRDVCGHWLDLTAHLVPFSPWLTPAEVFAPRVVPASSAPWPQAGVSMAGVACALFP